MNQSKKTQHNGKVSNYLLVFKQPKHKAKNLSIHHPTHIEQPTIIRHQSCEAKVQIEMTRTSSILRWH